MGSRNWWDKLTPWDTKHEKSLMEDPYKDQIDDLTKKANTVTEPVPVYDDQGRTIGLKDPDTGEMVKDYSDLWTNLDRATSQTIPGLNDWMSNQGYSFYDPGAKDESGNFVDPTMQNMQDLITQLQSGPSAMDEQNAISYAEQAMGLAPGTYQDYMSGLRQKADTPISDQQGMSDQERAIRERENRNQLRQMDQRAQQLIDNVRASTGSAARSYATADAAISQINDAQLQQQVEIANDDFARKQAESDKDMQRYEIALQSGQVSASQYMSLLQQSKATALQGYAQQVNTMMEQNQQYLQMYGSDLSAIQANIDNIYKGINAEIGIDSKTMDDTERIYQQQMQPILDQMNIAYQNLELVKSEESTFSLGTFLAGAATLGLAFIPGIGTAASAALATGGSSILGASF